MNGTPDSGYGNNIAIHFYYMAVSDFSVTPYLVDWTLKTLKNADLFVNHLLAWSTTRASSF
jgi:hypothetical protein